MKINNDETMLEMLKRHEGYRQFPYRCSAGKLTCGYGRNLTDVGISKYEAMILLVHDMEIAFRDVRSIFSEFSKFSKNRRNALTDMIFNLGKTRFLGFKKMIAAVKGEDWEEVAKQAEDSRWFGQVGNRGKEVVSLLRSG